MRLTVLGSTDLHGNVYNWDYFKNAEFDNAAHDDIGLAKVATLVKAMRKTAQGRADPDARRRRHHPGHAARVLLREDRPDQRLGVIHPMARAMNLVKYDAAALGNHEFNYGLDTLRTFEEQLDFPLLGANAVDPVTKRPAFRPYLIKTFKVGRGRTLKVGILGLTNPGIAIWDKANVEGKMEFPGLVEQAKKFVPELKKKGCDLVVVSAHSGADTSSSYGDALPYPENAASLVAEQVPHVDAILVGHAHKEIAQQFVENKKTGQQVLLCEPYYWGMRLAVMDLVVQEVYTRARQAGVACWSTRLAAAQLQHGRRRPGRGARRCQPARHRRRLRELAGRHVDGGAVRGARRRRGRADHRLRQLRAGRRGQGRPHRRRAVAAGAVDRGAVQPRGVVPLRRGLGPRRRRALHLRQHAARREGHRRRREGLPRVLRPLLQAGLRHRAVHDGAGDQRRHRRPPRTAPPTTTTTPSPASTPR